MCYTISMKWVHRLTNIDKKQLKAECSNCGLVSIKKRKSGFRCREVVNAEKRKSHLAKTSGEKPDTCEACGGNNKISFDHDHQTGEHRGWLCHNCNTALGLLKDNINTLQNLIGYLS